MMKLAIFGLFCLQAVLAAHPYQDLRIENTTKQFADIFSVEDCLAVGKRCPNGECCRNSDWVCCPHGSYCAKNAESCPVSAASTTTTTTTTKTATTAKTPFL